MKNQAFTKVGASITAEGWAQMRTGRHGRPHRSPRRSGGFIDRQAVFEYIEIHDQPGWANRVPDDQPSGVSRLLQHWANGNDKALGDLLPLVYDELRRVARHHLRQERPDHTLQSTALVHEAYLRLLGSEPPELRNRPHFIAVASRLIRQILVDYARERRAAKRDGGQRVAVEFLDALPVSEDAELLALNDALNDLYKADERQGRIVDMKFFGGLSSPEVSEVLGLSRTTVDRDWATARAWLHRQMSKAKS